MLNIILVDNPSVHTSLLPITFTRPISHLLIGIDTIIEKWQRLLPARYSCQTAEYLSELFTPENLENADILIDSNIIPTPQLVNEIISLDNNQELIDSDGNMIARRQKAGATFTQTSSGCADIIRIKRITDLFTFNDQVTKSDFRQITNGLTSQPISSTCCVIGDPSEVFIAEGACVEGVFLNTTAGPIYIGVGAEVMEGSCLRGPIAIGDHSKVNMSTKIYGATSIGRHCKVGGEINNTIIHDYSNKAHDGFLGNAVIGSWCNLGAGCVASNLKNDYTEIKLWDYNTRRFTKTGLQFCGLIMGDHSKAGINTMFNTATVVGVGVNIHGTGFPRNFVASFSEGSATTGFSDVPMSKFFAIAQRVMARRNVQLTDHMRQMFEAIRRYADQLK